MSNKKGYFGQHAKSSAVFVSLIIHAVLIVVAISFVAVRVYVKEEKIFEVKKGIRPQMKLIKLRLPANVKKRKNPAPKLRENFVSKPKTKSMNIALPKMVGIKGSMDHLDEGGLGGIDFGLDLDLFGGDKGSGNEFQGTFFDLKMNPDGEPGKMDEQIYLDVLRSFANSWNISRFSKRYFKAPKNKFATTFMLPKMSAEEAPKAYGVENVVKPKLWAVYYTGQIAAPETGRYRFWGIADNVLMVRVKKRLVIDANWPGMNISDWTSDDERDKKFKMSNQGVRIGDWFHMTKGKAVDMEVLIGERPGGHFFCHLLIEQDGVEYPKGEGGRPLLPIFKTVEIPEKLIPEMKLEANTCTTEGPTFGILK